MAELKRVMISLPQNLLQEVDGIVALEKGNRSEFVREAMRLYLAERRRREIRERMKNGYMEMANINLTLAEEGIKLEREVAEFRQVTNVECE